MGLRFQGWTPLVKSKKMQNILRSFLLLCLFVRNFILTSKLEGEISESAIIDNCLDENFPLDTRKFWTGASRKHDTVFKFLREGLPVPSQNYVKSFQSLGSPSSVVERFGSSQSAFVRRSRSSEGSENGYSPSSEIPTLNPLSPPKAKVQTKSYVIIPPESESEPSIPTFPEKYFLIHKGSVSDIGLMVSYTPKIRFLLDNLMLRKLPTLEASYTVTISGSSDPEMVKIFAHRSVAMSQTIFSEKALLQKLTHLSNILETNPSIYKSILAIQIDFVSRNISIITIFIKEEYKYNTCYQNMLKRFGSPNGNFSRFI